MTIDPDVRNAIETLFAAAVGYLTRWFQHRRQPKRTP